MRYPLEPLERVLGTHEARNERGYPSADSALARIIGVTRASVCQSRRRGLSEAQADLYATRAGFHPAQIWDGWLEEVTDSCEWCGGPPGKCRGVPCRRYDRRRVVCWWRRLDRYRVAA